LEDDEDIIDLAEVGGPGAPATAADADDIDEIVNLEPNEEATVIDTHETAEIIDLTISEQAIPAREEDQHLTFPDENTEDDDIIDLGEIAPAIETAHSDTVMDDSMDEQALDLFDAVEPETHAAQWDNKTDAVPPAETFLTNTSDLDQEPDINTIQVIGPITEDSQDLLAPDEYADDEEIIDLAEMETALDADISDNILEDHQLEDDGIDLVNSVAPRTHEAEGDLGGPLEKGLTPPAPSEPLTDTTTVPFTDQQLEAALERTIRNIYAEKIEQLMIQAIEKTVRQEIAKIKQALMENDDNMSD
jgi:hypothetical protein